MADSRDLKIVVSVDDKASPKLKQIGENTESAGEKFKAFAARAEIGAIAVTAALTVLAKKVIDVGINMEDTRMSFETMLGGGEQAGKLLKEISEFARKTPFDLPQVLEGSKRLLAYNISAEKIIPTFTMLGNIAAGVGKDKLPQLILAFGQVKAATKLTGAELRQFSEAGVPLLEALVNKANESGGSLVKVGGASAALQKKASSLSATIVDQQFKLKYLAEQGKQSSSQYKNLGESIDFNKAKLKSFGSVGQSAFVKVQATAASMIEQISDGKVSFDMVNDALMKMTSEGGKFNNLMAKLSTTLGGVLSNTRDEITRLVLDILGFTDTFEIREGSIFFYLKKGAERFLEILQVVSPIITNFVDNLVKNQTALFMILSAVVATVGLLAGALIVLMLPFLKIIAVAMLLGAVISLLRQAWINNFLNIRVIVTDVVNFLVNKVFPVLVKALAFLIDVVTKITTTMISAFSFVAKALSPIFIGMAQNAIKSFQFLAEGIFASMDATLGIIQFALEIMSLLLGGNLKGIVDYAVGVFGGLASGVGKAVNSVLSIITQFINKVVDKINVLVDSPLVRWALGKEGVKVGKIASTNNDGGGVIFDFGQASKDLDNASKKVAEYRAQLSQMRSSFQSTSNKAYEGLGSLNTSIQGADISGVLGAINSNSSALQKLISGEAGRKEINNNVEINFHNTSVKGQDDIDAIIKKIKESLNKDDSLYAQGVYS